MSNRVLVVLLCLCAMSMEAACTRDQPPHYEAPPGDKTAATVIHDSPKLTSIESSAKDSLGREIRVACVTCHAVRDAGAGFPESTAALKDFHVGLTFKHGELPCAACHVTQTGGVPMLHLADGAPLGTGETLRLCAQCHGPKYQDYLHGSHGGMNGYWDLSKGPRLRNHCVDCHDPHAPQFPASRPVLPPKDRFVAPPNAPHSASSSEAHDG